MFTKKNKKIIYIVVLTTALLLALTSIAMAAVWTDQADYAPGSVVTISGDTSDGAGYVPGNTVHVDVVGPNGYTAECDAVVDEAGAWNCQVTLWDSDLAIGEYTYTTISYDANLNPINESGAFTDGNAEFSGTVKDANDNPISGATISCTAVCDAASSTTTDSNGHYPLSGKFKPSFAGSGCTTLTLTASKTGYTSDVKSKYVCHNDAVSLDFTLTASGNTPPTVSVTGVTNGASYEFGSVPVAGCSVSDAEDGDSTFAATLAAISGPLSAYGLGSQTASCSYTDAGGLSASDSVTYSIVDTTKPEISCGSADGLWHAEDVSIACTASDNVALLYSSDANFSLTTNVPNNTEDANASTNSYKVYDVAGNYATAGPIGGNMVDKKAPELSGCDSPDGMWHATDVTLKCTYTDGGSRPAIQNVSLSTSVAAGTETANAIASAGGAKACDAVDNCAASPADISGNKVDMKAPQLVNCDAPDGLWHATDVTLKCTYSDGGSGPATQDVSLTTNVTLGTETDNAVSSAGGAKACDAVGNCAASPADIGGNKVDKKAPTITIAVPSAADYTLNAIVKASYSCSDNGSGVASCTGTVANGSNIDTASVGSKTFTVNATDKVGNSSGDVSVTYYVKYATGGMCLGSPGHAILQPIDADGGSVFKQKSTVPAKFRVCDANDVSIGSPGVVASFRLLYSQNGTISNVDEAVVSTTPDTEFRWSSTDQQWIFNINTKNLSAGRTYYYRITLNDGSWIDFSFGLK